MKLWWGAIVLGFAWGALLGDNALAAHGTVQLLTVEEAAMADAPAGLIDAGRTEDAGPAINVVQPAEDRPLHPPLEIDIRFVPKGSEIDLSTLKVEVLKILTIDITDRILPYATKAGIRVERAGFPPGEHRIRVTVGDIGGGITMKVLLVRVL